MPTKRFCLHFFAVIIGATFFLLLAAGCNKENKNKSKIPAIKYIGISGDSIKSGSNEIVQVVFNFSDGDGDLGNKPSSGKYDIYTTDSRDTSKINYYFPQGLTGNIDPTQGISGTCTLSLEAAFILLRPERPQGDTVRYEIYIKDKAGNESNRFTTPDIYIRP